MLISLLNVATSFKSIFGRQRDAGELRESGGREIRTNPFIQICVTRML